MRAAAAARTVRWRDSGHLRPAHVTPDRVARLIRDLEARGLSAATIRSYVRPLSAILRLAIVRGALTINPLDLLSEDERPRARVQRNRFEWSPESIGRLLEAARQLDARPAARTSYHPLILTLALTGCRVGEALALTWADVDLLDAVVRVRASWSRTGELTTSKTRASVRTVPIPPQLVNGLVQHKPENAKEEDFVFSARHSRGPISYWNFRSRGFAEAARKAGLKGQVDDPRSAPRRGELADLGWPHSRRGRRAPRPSRRDHDTSGLLACFRPIRRSRACSRRVFGARCIAGVAEGWSS